MSWICEKPKLIFFHNPRTAGTSIAQMLQSKYGATSYAHCYAHDPDATNWVKDHSTDVPPGKETWRRITFVRNPFARELSFYFWHKRSVGDNPIVLAAKKMSFLGYLRWRIDHKPVEPFVCQTHGTQSRYLLDCDAEIYRFEDLVDNFADSKHSVVRFLGKHLPYASDTQSPPYDLCEYYNYQTMALVRHYAAADFLNFGYDSHALPRNMSQQHEMENIPLESN